MAATKHRFLLLFLLLTASACTHAAHHVGEIRCGRVSVELDTASSSDDGVWQVSDDVRKACGIVGAAPVPGRVDGDALVLDVPPDRLAPRFLAASDVPFTAGWAFPSIDWSATATQRGMFLSATARYKQGRASAWFDSASSRVQVSEAFYQDDRWRAGTWLDGGDTLIVELVTTQPLVKEPEMLTFELAVPAALATPEQRPSAIAAAIAFICKRFIPSLP
jgi:hypothetical protein